MRYVRVSKADQKITPFVEVGSTGLTRFGGWVSEEWLKDLQGIKGIKIYKEMRDNDPVIGAILFVIKMLIRQTSWRVEAGGVTAQDEEAKAFLESCLDDMSVSWYDTITEILSMLVFGWSWHEIVYKRRMGDSRDPTQKSKYTDGRISWRKMPIRAQETFWQWVFDDEGGVSALKQLPPPDYQIREIPIEKSLLFRTESTKNNPEGRALALDTPVPTPDGWITMGGIKVGDKVYGADGKFRYVVEKSDIWADRPVYEITFSAGEKIIADENHLWSITTFNDRHNDKAARTLTTKEIFEWFHRDAKNPSFCVGKVPVIDGQFMLLPIDPYILGYWLGDGTHVNGSIAVSEEDVNNLIDHANRAGYIVSFDGDRKAYISGIKVLLDSMGLLGNKHIPQEYLRAHEEQRLALLQGLMDSDGTSFPGKDRASKWYNSNERLIKRFCELVRTLGGRPHVRIHTGPGHLCGTINGKQIVQKKNLYEVSFFLSLPVHRLKRKQEKQDIKNSLRVRGHYIRDIKFIGHRDTVCVEVDSPDHLFLAGDGFVPTHNSILRNAYRPYYFKKNIEEIEAIGVERDLAGLPVATVPPEIMLPTATADQKAVYASVKQMVTSIRRDSMEGIVMPAEEDSNGKKTGYKLSLLTTGGRRNFDTTGIIVRYDQRIAMTVLADVILLGHEKVGSYSLADSKTSLLGLAIGAILDSITEIFNTHAVPKLFALNTFQGLSTLPSIAHGDIETPDLKELGDFISSLSGSGMPLFPDDALENHLRSVANLPEKPKDGPMPIPKVADTNDPGKDVKIDNPKDLAKYLVEVRKHLEDIESGVAQ